LNTYKINEPFVVTSCFSLR